MQCQPPYLYFSLGSGEDFPSEMMLWLCFISVRVRTNAGDEGIWRRTLIKAIESKQSHRKQKSSWCQCGGHSKSVPALCPCTFQVALFRPHLCVSSQNRCKSVSLRQKESVAIVSILSKPEVRGQKTKSAMTCSAASGCLSFPFIFWLLLELL